MTSSNESATFRFHLIRINDQQDFLFVRLDVDKKQSLTEAELQRAAGGVWVGEYAADDQGEVKAMVFVNAMKGAGIGREEVVSTLNCAVSRLTRKLEAQLANPGDSPI